MEHSNKKKRKKKLEYIGEYLIPRPSILIQVQEREKVKGQNVRNIRMYENFCRKHKVGELI